MKIEIEVPDEELKDIILKAFTEIVDSVAEQATKKAVQKIMDALK